MFGAGYKNITRQINSDANSATLMKIEESYLEVSGFFDLWVRLMEIVSRLTGTIRHLEVLQGIQISKWNVEEKILSEPWKVYPFLNLSIECVEMLCASN